MILPEAKTPHSKEDSRDTARLGVNLTREAVISEAEEVSNMIKGIIIEAEASQEEAEGMRMVMVETAIPITLEVEEDPFKDDPGGHVGFNHEEGGMCRKLEQETQSIGVYHSIDISAGYAEAKAIMIISAIPSNI